MSLKQQLKDAVAKQKKARDITREDIVKNAAAIQRSRQEQKDLSNRPH
ncbi:hypothetical protein LCGC14_0984160 [marine sediment metagenome]|uniref:Uncharacterized protein n=1 Tax=marine sediment metagenome TaxID=412755 RepID=A0A0F9NCC6_9ZZZZ